MSKNYTCDIRVVIKADNPQQAEKYLLSLYDYIEQQPWVLVKDDRDDIEEDE